MLDPIDRETETALKEAVETDRLESHVAEFASLRRYPGSEDQWRAAEYVVDTLAEAGVDAELKTLTAQTSVPQSASVSVTAPVQLRFADAITTSFGASTPNHGISGKLSVLDSIEPEDPPAGVEGTIVFTRGLPTPEAVTLLDQAGAKAAVFGSPTPGHLHEMTVSPVWGTPSVANRDRLPELPVAEVHHSDGDRLRTLARGGSVEVTVTTTVETTVRELPCPVGRIDGTDTDRYLVVGNHIDSWHEGVTDNATAVAATLELARVLAKHRPKRGALFGFWPGHSMGRYAGSTRYVDENWLELRENGVAYLHLDLNGLDGADQLWYQHMSEVAAEHRDVLADGPLPCMEETQDGGDGLIGSSDRPGRNSDQSFWGAGLTSLLSGGRFSDGHEDGGPVGGGWWWHTPADTEDKVDYELLAAETELYAAILSRYCFSPVLPHDFRETAAQLRSAVEAVESAAQGSVDFETVYERLDELEAALEQFTATVERYGGTEVPTAIEDVQVALGNTLIPALYMESPPYEHDPALAQELLPYLRIAEKLPDHEDPRRTYTEVRVQRGVSKLASELTRATETVTGFLEGR